MFAVAFTEKRKYASDTLIVPVKSSLLFYSPTSPSIMVTAHGDLVRVGWADRDILRSIQPSSGKPRILAPETVLRFEIARQASRSRSSILPGLGSGLLASRIILPTVRSLDSCIESVSSVSLGLRVESLRTDINPASALDGIPFTGNKEVS